MVVIFDLCEISAFFKVLYNLFPCFVPVKTPVNAAVLVDHCIFVKNQDFFETVALAYLKVVGVVARRDLDASVLNSASTYSSAIMAALPTSGRIAVFDQMQ